MDMGHEVPATVGDGDGEVAELQGRTGDITLSHTSPPDRLSIPPFLIATVQVVGACQESALFTWDIDVHGSAQAHRLHIGAPGGVVMASSREAYMKSSLIIEAKVMRNHVLHDCARASLSARGERC